MNRIIAHGVKAREELTKGADFLADCVKSTLGLYGQNWFLDKKNKITNDGVAVAREIQLSKETLIGGFPANELNNRGATAMREAAIKTVEEVGDGTTTAVILAQAIYHECARFLSTDSVIGKKTPSEIIRQVESERKEVIDKLTKVATPIETEEQLVNSAIVSMGDKELGTLIGKAQWRLGKEGRLLAEETADRESSVEFVKGITIDNGFGTSLLVTNQEKQTLEVENTKILLTSYTIHGSKEFFKIKSVIEQIHKAGSNQLVIVARAWGEEGLKLCLENINKGSVKIYPLSAPYVNMAQKMKDLSALTGATYYDSESTRLEDIQISDIGYAERVVARRMDGIITGKESPETQARVDKRIEELKDEMNGTPSDFEKNHIGQRIAQLQGGFGVIKVGSPSDMERKRLFDKTDDAVHAVRAAFQEGTVPGAGLAFKEISESMPDTYLLKRPLLTIYQQIMSSAPKDFVVESTVSDPLKVLRVALQNACATASSFATAGGIVTEAWHKDIDELLRKPSNNEEN